ncbi:hypothetical protein [Pseudomonas syringae group genomosp. 7]|uniref:hypothetical protein n=1 Tax=Pseudomonas syringae group genomosp. 7 TaxID=251699 RepID=UPI003B9824DB
MVHAGDPDDEGQLLVEEVLEYFGNTAPVKRILINDMNATPSRHWTACATTASFTACTRSWPWPAASVISCMAST